MTTHDVRYKRPSFPLYKIVPQKFLLFRYFFQRLSTPFSQTLKRLSYQDYSNLSQFKNFTPSQHLKFDSQGLAMPRRSNKKKLQEKLDDETASLSQEITEHRHRLREMKEHYDDAKEQGDKKLMRAVQRDRDEACSPSYNVHQY